MAEKFVGNDLTEREQEALESDSLLSDEERKEMDRDIARRVYPFHELLIKRGLQLNPKEIPPAVQSLYDVLLGMTCGTYTVDEAYEFLEKYGDFEGIGLLNATSEAKKEFLQELFADEQVRAIVLAD